MSLSIGTVVHVSDVARGPFDLNGLHKRWEGVVGRPKRCYIWKKRFFKPGEGPVNSNNKGLLDI